MLEKDRQLDRLVRRDMRRSPGQPDPTQNDPTNVEGFFFRQGVEGDFWKASEHEKCKRGVTMVSDDRGLPPGYMDKRPVAERGPNRTTPYRGSL